MSAPPTPPPFDIRRLGGADVRDYRSIRLAALQTEPDSFGSVHAVEAARSLADFRDALESAIVLGAYCDGRIVGMIGCRREPGIKDDHKGFVWGFYVDPEQRSRGVGGALLAALIDAARDLVEQLMLTVVPASRSAITLYERFGFVTYGVEPRSLKTDAGYADQMLMALIYGQS